MRHLTLILFLFFSTIIFSQTITGKVVDSLGDISFADVILKDAKNNIVAGTTTNDDGTFSIKTIKGNYVLIVSFLGYSNWDKNIKVLKNVDLKTILLTEDSQTLDEVVIKSKKRVIERKVDRLVFNVEKSVVASTGTAEDILKIAPRVQIQNGAIEIIGKGNARVMINGRISPLENEELIDFLNGLGANEIKSVEIITNPPANYEAAGDGGLINIILKKGIQNSWKNTTNLTYNQNRYQFGTLRNSFFLNTNKISLTASINTTQGSLENTENIQVRYPFSFRDIDIDNEEKRNKYSGRFLIDYNVSNTLSLGVQYLGSISKPSYSPVTTTSIFNEENELENKLINTGDFNIKESTHNVNLHATKTLDTLGRKVSVDVDYLQYTTDRNRDFMTNTFNSNNVFTGVNSSGKNISNQEITNFSSKVDVTYPINNLKLSFGGKASVIETKSNAQFFNTITGASVLDKSLSNEFMYNETNIAVYASGNTQLNNKIQLKLGVRLENTSTKGKNITINQEDKNNYTKLFPTLYLSYEKNENNSFGFNYGKRINRPRFSNLNPFRIFISDNTYSEGNPFLQPSFTDSFEFSHAYKRKLNTSVFFNVLTEGKGTIFTANLNDDTQVVSRDNYYNQYSYGITEAFSYNKISWWESQNNITFVGYKTNFTKNIGATPKDGFGISVASNNTFLLSESTKMQMNASYNSKQSAGLYSLGDMYNLSLGLQHHFKKSHIKVSIYANDILDTASINDYTSIVNGVIQIYGQNHSSRNVQIGISYDFGNKKLKENNRGFGNEEEQNRAN